MPSIIFNTHRNHLDIVAQGRIRPSFSELLQMSITFCLTALAWIFFRATDLPHAFAYISGIFAPSIFKLPYFSGIGTSIPVFILIIVFFIIEWCGREQQYAIQTLGLKSPNPVRWAAYYCLILVIFYFAYASETNQQFIYFQF
jgi:alginate O-acetyltransferase complex protein AlgI